MNAVLDQTSSFLMKKVFDLQENKISNPELDQELKDIIKSNF